MSAINKPDFAAEVMDRIEAEQIKTYSRLWFVANNWLFWMCWLISVLVGSSALAALLFVMCGFGSVGDLPYLWFLSFVALCLIAHLTLRQTPKGYRYSVWLLLFLNLGVTAVIGMMLFLAGIGQLIDMHMRERVFHQPRNIECRGIAPYDHFNQINHW